MTVSSAVSITRSRRGNCLLFVLALIAVLMLHTVIAQTIVDNEDDSSSLNSLAISNEDLFLPPYDIYNPKVTPIPKALQVQVDTKRYIGRWFEIFRKPLIWQSQCVANVIENYTLSDDNTVLTSPICTTQDGSISKNNAEGFFQNAPEFNTELKVSFLPRSLNWLLKLFPFLAGDYWILEVTEDPNDKNAPYLFSLVGSPDKKYLWLLSRVPNPTNAQIQHFLDRAEIVFGYDLSDVMYTPQDGVIPDGY